VIIAMIKSVVRCPNDMVLVFDEDDEQVPEYQGNYRQVKKRILKEAPSGTLFGHWFDLKTDVKTVSRDEW
jgi:hypothetical protein